MPILPLLVGLIPTLVNTAEKLITGPAQGDQKKKFVMSLLGWIYDKFLVGKLPDLPGLDERQVFIEIADSLVEYVVEHSFNRVSG